MWLTIATLLLAPGDASAQAGAPTDPSAYGECAPGGDSRTLKLDVSVDPTTVVPTRSQEREPAAPHASKVRVTLINPGPKKLRLTFPNPCFLGYRVEAIDGRQVPREDAPVCAAVLGELELAPGTSETKEFRWTARGGEDSYTPLPAGKYRIIGTLAKRFCGRQGQEEPPLQTAPVVVEVRPAAN
jgi:hypothetical protein